MSLKYTFILKYRLQKDRRVAHRVTKTGTTSDNECYRVKTSGTTSNNEWQRVVQRMTTSAKTNGNEWYNERQWMATSDKSRTTNDNKWQWVTAYGREWYNKWERIRANKTVILSYKMKQKANLVPEKLYSVFYAILYIQQYR